MAPPIQYDTGWAAEMKRQFEQDWSKPLPVLLISETSTAPTLALASAASGKA